jgi:plastocyanin
MTATGARPLTAGRTRPGPGRISMLVLRLLAAAGLAIDAYVHADLAPVYDGVRASISQGNLFRIEAGLAAAAALLVLFASRKIAFGLALAVAGGGLAALLLYRYVNVGKLGPLPNMYEPSWFPEKTLAAVAEAAVVLIAIAGLLWAVRHRASAPRPNPRLQGLVLAGGLATGVAVGAFAGPALPAVTGAGAATSPATAPASGSQRVTITGTDSLRFSPMVVHVRAGSVRITLMDMGAYPHNIVIPGLKVTSPTVTGDPGGTMATFTVRFPRPGSYPFYCQYHQSAGMTGTFVVS